MPIRFRKRKAPPTECIGVCLFAGGFACCVIDRTANRLIHAHQQLIANEAALADALSHWVRETGVKGRVCYVSLGPEDYKLIPIEAPDVPAEEVNQALLWGMRDVLESKPEDTVLDSFPNASGIQRSGKPIRQVVAARRARILAIADAVTHAGLELGAIEIPELSQRNLIARLQDNSIGAGLISQSSRGVSLTIYRNGEMYVNRHLTGLSNLADASHPLTAPKLVDQLGLELLRTLDYYDSQLRQRPPAGIWLQPLAIETRLLIDGLTSTINLPVKQLRVDDIIVGADKLPKENLENCFVALGAALHSDDSSQRINLYTEDLQPKRTWLTPQHCEQLWAATLIVGLVVGALLTWRNHALFNQAKQIQAQLQSEQAALSTASAQLAERSPSATLAAELQRRSSEEAAKTELLNALESGALKGKQGYSPILNSLAKNTIEGLWLTAIEINGSDVNLAGSARKAELIPNYIEQLVNAADFGPRGYESLDIKSAEGGILNFNLRAHRNNANDSSNSAADNAITASNVSAAQKTANTP